MIESKVTYEKLNTIHLKGITELFNLVKNQQLNYTFFQKKYSTNWCNEPLLGIVAFNEHKKIIGFCGTTLYKFNQDQQLFVIAQLGDLLVHPQHQGKGIFSTLLSKLEEETNKRNLDGLVVFPNSNAQPIFRNRKEWNQIGNFIDSGVIVRTYPLLKLLNKMNISNLFYPLSTILGSTTTPKTSWELVNQNNIHVFSNDDYFNYKRYQKFRFHQYANKEFLWSLSDGILINGSKIETIEELNNEISFLRRFCKKRGIHQFRYICHDCSILNSMLIQTEMEVMNVMPIFFKSNNKLLHLEKIVFQGIDRNAF